MGNRISSFSQRFSRTSEPAGHETAKGAQSAPVPDKRVEGTKRERRVNGVREWFARVNSAPAGLPSRPWHGGNLRTACNINLEKMLLFPLAGHLHYDHDVSVDVLREVLSDITAVVLAHDTAFVHGQSDPDSKKKKKNFEALARDFARTYKKIFVQNDVTNPAHRAALRRLMHTWNDRIPLLEVSSELDTVTQDQVTHHVPAKARGLAEISPKDAPGFDRERTAPVLKILRDAYATMQAGEAVLAHNDVSLGSAADTTITTSLPKWDAELATQEWRTAMMSGNQILRSWMEANGIAVIRSSGFDDSCLIHALLQHVTGAYHLSAFDVTRWRAVAGEDGALFQDSEGVKRMLAEMNKFYNTSVCVHYVSSDKDGRPVVVGPVGDGENPVVIWHQGNHYEALVMRDTGKGSSQVPA